MGESFSVAIHDVSRSSVATVGMGFHAHVGSGKALPSKSTLPSSMQCQQPGKLELGLAHLKLSSESSLRRVAPSEQAMYPRSCTDLTEREAETLRPQQLSMRVMCAQSLMPDL